MKGYLNDLPQGQYNSLNHRWYFDNVIHNRIDFSWNFQNWGSGIGWRNIFFAGQTLTSFPSEKTTYLADPGLLNMTWELDHQASSLLYTQFDRAWLAYSKGKIQFTAGRQRINWGQAIVWNPNDIFNTYSLFDIDYPERPGSDAFRFQYFTSSVSVLELAAKWNHQGKITLAGMRKFNFKNYDLQFLAGLVDDQDYTAGLAWSGNLKNAAFRGELNYYLPKENFQDTSALLIATVGLDYTLSNSLGLTFQVLYNQKPGNSDIRAFLDLNRAPSSPKMLSFTEWNILLMASYPLTPLLNLSLTGIYFPGLEGYYINPSFDWNIKTNLDLSLFYEFIICKLNPETNSSGQTQELEYDLAALRLKWSF